MTEAESMEASRAENADGDTTESADDSATPDTPRTGDQSPQPVDTSQTSPSNSLNYSFTAPDATAWIRPGFAVIVVCVVATLILGILVVSVLQIHAVVGNPPGPDPNAGTIAALAGAALSAITSLSAAYFGIKVASEQSSQASTQASAATTHALTVLGNSTAGSGSANRASD